MFYIISAIFLLILVYVYLTWNYNHWKNLNIPHVKPTLLFGNIKDALFGKTNPGVIFADLYSKFPTAPYVGFYNMRTPSIMLRDPELIKSILVKDFIHFDQNDFDIDPNQDPILTTNIFLKRGELWKKNRSAWTHGLTSSKIKLLIETLNEKCDLMIEHLKSQIKNNPNEEFDSKDISSSFIINSVVKSIFGLEVDCFKEKESIYKSIANSFFSPSFFEGLFITVYVLFPKVMKFFNIPFIPNRVAKQVRGLSKNILDVRQNNGYQTHNSLDVILQRQTEDKHGLENQISGLIFNFLLDGTETSAIVLGFALYEISKNPDVQTKLKNELDEFYESNDEITWDNITKLTYLEMILSETLRLYTPALVLQKLCTKTYFLPAIHPGTDPVEIKEGTSITIPVYALHMDPEHFPDPERFDPERFSPENKNNINKYAYLPFGEGPRVCIGMRMAMNQMKIGVAGIVKNFEIQTAPKMKNTPLVIEPFAILFKVIGNVWITLHNRS